MKNSQPRPLFDLATWLLAAVQACSAAWVALRGPEGSLPVHFDWHGQPNGWGDRNEIALVLLGLAVLTLASKFLLAQSAWRVGIDPANSTVQGAARLVMLIAMGGATALMLSLGMGTFQGGHMPWVGALVWLTLIGIGAVIGKVKPNKVTGVRVYWTRHSRLAWDRSNRLLGRIWFFGGLVGLATMPLVNDAAGAMLPAAVSLFGAVVAVFESWRVWRKDPERTA
ncbi:SdpI family protein [Piscinibacter terrae]|uniref:DUF1648 domain-containing protein n=1 Tax=Piscinibacter terrae TaxID=2496871 RepID=A0A3N7JW22_9BURK|nr:SdpI family protein [Albitalea terrae]RQP23075.1 hypothetical protein DZC73_18295 [Albitalea terrae]